MHTRVLSTFATGLTLLTLIASSPANAAISPVVCVQAGLAAGGPARSGGGPQAPAVTILAQPGQAYVHTSTPNNTLADYTDLENPALNGQPNAKFLVTANVVLPNYDNPAPPSPEGVFYDNGGQRWAIYNDTQTLMPENRAWNVFIPPQDGTLSVITSTAGAVSDIVDPEFFNNPNAVIFVQHVYNPGGLGSNLYTHTVAVTYDVGSHYWAIRNADGSSMPSGITFFALVASADETYFTQTVTPANHIAPPLILLDHPLLNGNPDAQILVTQNYGTGVVNNHEIGVSYAPTVNRWVIYNRDVAALPLGAVFNVLVVPPKSGHFVQAATADNTIDNLTFLGDGFHALPDLDGHPEALVYVAHNWNPPQSLCGTYNDHPIGVQYLNGFWALANLDGAPMQQGLFFNVYYTWPRGNAFSVSASSTNSSGSSMTTNSPLLNGNPDAIPIASFNASPAGQTAVITYTQPVGLRYNSALTLTAWQVFNNSGPAFAMTQTSNVLMAPGSFVVTATGTTIATGVDYFFIDNPLTNDNPEALVFATPRDSSGINQQNIGVYYDNGAQRWAIFNENQSSMPPSVYDVFVTAIRLFLPLLRK